MKTVGVFSAVGEASRIHAADDVLIGERAGSRWFDPCKMHELLLLIRVGRCKDIPMSNHDRRIDEQPEQFIGDYVELLPAGRGRALKTGASGWLISGSIHLSALSLAWLAVFGAPRLMEKDPPVTHINFIEPPQPHIEKPKLERTIEPKPVIDVTIQEIDAVSPVSNLAVPLDEHVHEEQPDVQQTSGREEAVADSENGRTGTFTTPGVGGGGAGMFGHRGSGRKRAVGLNGGSQGSEAAVDASLRWFKRHQSPNGSWETDKYFQNCTQGAKCEPGGDPQMHGSDCNIAMTGYALLCFLGAGHDHLHSNPYRTTVKKGIDWLLSVQSPEGYCGRRNYEHPIAIMALAEAYAMTSDPELRAPAQKGIDQILARQNQQKVAGADGYAGGLGWDYYRPNDRNDSSVTGWNIMALKSGLAGGLNVGKGMEGAKRWLEGHWKASNSTDLGPNKSWKEMSAYDMSRFAYCWHHDGCTIEGEAGRESIGLACAVFLGHLSGDVMAESLANTVMAKQLPRALPANTYYMYYNTLAMFQMGGERWQKWNGVVRDLLVNSQRKTTDCLDGSWDWNKTDFGGAEAGRVLTTAYNTLSLQVYYRYAQVKDLHRK